MEEELAAVDALLSTWRDDSELARFNAAPAGEWFPVSGELAALVERALATGRETGGAFDITVAPLLALWGFGPAAGGAPRQVPDSDAIERARARTGIDGISVRHRPPALRKSRPGLVLTLDGIAQGYTVDRLAARLDDRGVRRYLVELGGELFGRGENPRGRPWTIGIEKPLPGVRELETTVAIDGAGLSTSGDYRDFFVAGGRRYSHTIDPRTGRPVGHDLRSVSVAADSVERADALATALLVMGPEQGFEHAREQGLAALFIHGGPDAYTQVGTEAFRQYMERQ